MQAARLRRPREPEGPVISLRDIRRTESPGDVCAEPERDGVLCESEQNDKANDINQSNSRLIREDCLGKGTP